jgi:hypothetical protein
MATHEEEFRPQSGSGGTRNAFRAPGRFGARRSARTGDNGSQAAQANEAFFAQQPPGTIAVRQDGVRLVVPGTPGDLCALDGENPEFFDRNGRALGHMEIQGVVDTPMSCSLFAISNLSKVRGGAYLAVWYLTGHTMATEFEVQSVNPNTLGRLLKRLGMKWMPGTKNMTGTTAEVCSAARRKCQGHHWRLRESAVLAT